MRAVAPYLLSLGLPSLAAAATLHVGPGGDHATLAEAIAAASADDVLELSAGTHAVDATVLVDVPVVITGSGATLTAGGTLGDGDALLEVAADVRLEGLTLRPGSGSAVVHTAGELVLFRATVQRGASPGASAVVSTGPVRLVVQEGTFQDLHATSPGGAVYAEGGATIEIRDVGFVDGSAPNGGAVALSGGGRLVIERGRFENVHATAGRGGAILMDGTSETVVHVTDSTFSGASATAEGGAVAVSGGAEVELLRNTFTACSAQHGGAVWLAALAGLPGAHLVEGNTFRENHAEERGGALVHTSGTMPYLHTNLWCRNHAGSAGGAVALENSGHIVENERFVGNTTDGDGGALWCAGSGGPRSLVRNIVFAGGSAGGRGAHLAGADCSVQVRNVLFLAASGAPALDAAPLDEAYNAYWNNAAGDVAGGTPHESSVLADPRLVAFSNDDDCDNDDLRPTWASPLRDAGDPTYTDPDGTRSDIGAYGGVTAPLELFEDSDLDFVVDLYDCGPDDPTIYPGGVERCDGLLDEDCDGEVDEDDAADAPSWWIDTDGDGFGFGEPVQACSAPPGTARRAGDCDDDAPDRNPGAPEVCNGVDDDCDGRVDDDDTVSGAPTWPLDADGDGFAGDQTFAACQEPAGGPAPLGDCNDGDPAIFPGADDPAGDGVDQDCDGVDGAAETRKDGCDCATGGGPTAGLLPLLLVAAASRRRHRR